MTHLIGYSTITPNSTPALMHKLRTLIIPKIAWKNLTVQQALDDLSDKSKQADRTHRGIPMIFVRNPESTIPRIHITFEAENKPLLEVMAHVGLWFTVKEFTVEFFHEGGGLSSSQGVVRSTWLF